MAKALRLFQTSKAPAVVDVEWAKHVLTSINWSFSSPFSVGRSGMQLFDCRKYHWYPATFIPEIPYVLIEVLSKPDAIVYDPFAGIGTTIFQSLMLGRRPLATEVCQVPVNIMRALWVLLNPDVDLSSVLTDIEQELSKYNEREDYTQCLSQVPVLANRLQPWFTREAFNQLSYLILYEQKSHTLGTKAVARVSLSACLKAVCSQNRGWGCIADNMLPKPEQLKKDRSALDRFGRNARVLVNDLVRFKADMPLSTQELLRTVLPESAILHSDARHASEIKNESIDLIVTSPPYPNMTDYAMSQRLSYYLFGAEPTKDLATEIGARRHRFWSDAIQRYKNDMIEVLQVIALRLKPGGYACFVMPTFDDVNKKNMIRKQSNMIRKQSVQECMAVLLSNDFVLEQELQRILPTRRRHHNQKWTSLEKEEIYIYRKLK